MLTLPAISAEDCIHALGVAGFARLRSFDDRTLLTRGSRIVSVPAVPLLDGETLHRILETAGLPASEFLDVLSTLSVRRIPVVAWERLRGMTPGR